MKMFWSLNIYLLCNSTVVFTYWTNNPFDLTFTTVLSIDVSINLKKKTLIMSVHYYFSRF